MLRVGKGLAGLDAGHDQRFHQVLGLIATHVLGKDREQVMVTLAVILVMFHIVAALPGVHTVESATDVTDRFHDHAGAAVPDPAPDLEDDHFFAFDFVQ